QRSRAEPRRRARRARLRRHGKETEREEVMGAVRRGASKGVSRNVNGSKDHAPKARAKQPMAPKAEPAAKPSPAKLAKPASSRASQRGLPAAKRARNLSPAPPSER